ncbi:hypothetical protein BSIN_2754 [Burkholderia singularis]|uniref:Uncharacterized protein n=1 Tax=Burkholderia singularis TaxID=1503053 RepID=A0A238H0X1_9BURK|nr:hypothetical protein BSIN_2754 [Burkholderia singularis]
MSHCIANPTNGLSTHSSKRECGTWIVQCDAYVGHSVAPNLPERTPLP